MKIDMGTAGRQTAAFVPTQTFQPQRDGIGPALQDAVAVGQGFADQAREERIRQEQRLKVSNATLAKVSFESDLLTLHDEMADGLKKKTVGRDQWQQTFTERAKELRDRHAGSVAPELQGELDQVQTVIGGRITRGLQNTVDDIVNEETGASLASTLEGLQRVGIKDPNLAIKQAGALKEQLTAVFGADGAQKRLQAFKEQVTYTQAFNAMTSASASVSSLQALSKRLSSEEFAGMDPQRRAALDSSIQSRMVALENRAAIQADRIARQQDQDFNAFTSFMNSGRLPSPDYAAQTMVKLKGSRYEDAVKQMITDAPASTGFASMPVAKQREAINGALAYLNTKGSDPAKEKELDRLQTVHQQTQSDINNRGALVAAADRGVIPAVAPIDLTNLSTLPQQLQVRNLQADTVSVWSGKQESPLQPHEADMVADQLKALPVQQRAALISTIERSVGPRRMAALSAQFGKRSTEIEVAGLLSPLTTSKGRNVAELYLEGKDAIAQGTIKVDATKETGTKATLYAELSGVFADQTSLDKAVEASFGVWAGRKRRDGAEDVSKAIELATGGVMERNGAKFLIPYGRTEDDVHKTIHTYAPAKLGVEQVLIGKSVMSADQFAKSLDGAQFQTAPGGYSVRFGPTVARKPDGSLLVISLE